MWLFPDPANWYYDQYGIDRERLPRAVRCRTHRKRSDKVESGQVIASWDPHTHPIISEVAGKVRFESLVEGVSVTEQVDDLTGSSTYLVMDEIGAVLRPTSNRRWNLSMSAIRSRRFDAPGASIVVNVGMSVGVGEVLARIPQESSRTRDITADAPSR